MTEEEIKSLLIDSLSITISERYEAGLYTKIKVNLQLDSETISSDYFCIKEGQ